MNKNLIKWSFLGLGVIIILIVVIGFVSWSNTEINLRNSFTQKQSERVAFYDKMSKVFNQKTQIAVKNDESFRRNIDIIMEGRKDSEQVLFKWVKETNPNAEYKEVSALYKDLSRAIESQREAFFIEEKVLQDIVKQHNNHLDLFPGSFYNLIYGREKLKYAPIQSDLTKQVFESGVDNNTKLEL